MIRGFDQFYRRPLPGEYQQSTSASYEMSTEDQSIIESLISGQAVGTLQIKDLAVTNAKIKDLQAEKILAGTIGVGLNIGGPSVQILGDDPDGGTILFYNNSLPSIVIGNPNVAQ